MRDAPSVSCASFLSVCESSTEPEHRARDGWLLLRMSLSEYRLTLAPSRDLDVIAEIPVFEQSDWMLVLPSCI